MNKLIMVLVSVGVISILSLPQISKMTKPKRAPQPAAAPTADALPTGQPPVIPPNAQMPTGAPLPPGATASQSSAASALGFVYSPEAFQEMASTTLLNLPTFDSLKKLKPEEVHGMPAIMQQAGISLGKIAQAINDDPHLADAGLDFYESCISRPDFPPQVRALCLADHRKIAKEGRRLDEGALPTTVVELANKVPH